MEIEDEEPRIEKVMSKKTQMMINKKNRMEANLREDVMNKIMEAVPNTRCTQLTVKELTKMLDNLTLRKKPKKPKQPSDELPQLFKWHLK